ncbi:hypothetical protein PO365_19215 [Klebsiella variicola]|uniref:hypothetical protein n=1 Tax=Klebsiella variicola TaxID=244366 RepID=UPI002FF54519
MFNPSAALFANTMLMFRLMFFHIKKPAEAGFIMLQCLFSGTSPADWLSPAPQRTAAGRRCRYARFSDTDTQEKVFQGS